MVVSAVDRLLVENLYKF